MAYAGSRSVVGGDNIFASALAAISCLLLCPFCVWQLAMNSSSIAWLLELCGISIAFFSGSSDDTWRCLLTRWYLHISLAIANFFSGPNSLARRLLRTGPLIFWFRTLGIRGKKIWDSPRIPDPGEIGWSRRGLGTWGRPSSCLTHRFGHHGIGAHDRRRCDLLVASYKLTLSSQFLEQVELFRGTPSFVNANDGLRIFCPVSRFWGTSDFLRRRICDLYAPRNGTVVVAVLQKQT